MRLIDADRLLTGRMKSKYYHLSNGDIAIPIIDIEHAPTIDAIEVVRCKDCKYADPDEGNVHWMVCKINKAPTFDDFFCGDGKRREEREVEDWDYT